MEGLRFVHILVTLTASVKPQAARIQANWNTGQIFSKRFTIDKKLILSSRDRLKKKKF